MKKAPQKVYVVDNGFVEAKAFSVSENLGRLLENHVFIELVRRGYHAETSLFYYRSRNDKETDFVTRQGAVIRNFVPPKFRKVKQPENGKVKQPTKYTIT